MMAFLPKQHLGRKKAYFNHGYPSILDSIIMILSGEAPGWCLHLYLWLFWGGSWIFMGLALKWLMWPVLMHCFGLPGQGTKKGMLPKYGRGWEESKDFLFNDTSGKYTSAQHWQSTMSCSGQSCQKHLNCNERAAFDWTQTIWRLQNIWTLHFKKTHISKRIQSKSAECTLPKTLPRPFKKHIGLKNEARFLERFPSTRTPTGGPCV